MKAEQRAREFSEEYFLKGSMTSTLGSKINVSAFILPTSLYPSNGSKVLILHA